MEKKKTMDEWMFALAVYPAFNSLERYSLFIELVEKCVEQGMHSKTAQPILEQSKKIKKLSDKKKASFASFLEKIDVQAEMRECRKKQISWKYIYSTDYPASLREIYTPPIVLFYKGDFTLINQYTWLGVVGARDCTDYGLEVVENIISELMMKAKDTVGIVSGLAKGIDTKAHEVTIKKAGKTVGVIGCGLDVYYPRSNKLLQRNMAENQLVISEYPLGSKPLKFHFPERNRIIAGLSRGVLVIEAKKSSGSLITAYNALEENRDVFAVPGSVLDKTNEGCHNLIQLGAVLTKNCADILQEWFII